MINFFSRFKIQAILDNDPNKFEPRPRRAWVIIFSCWVILIVFILIGNFYTYTYMRTNGSFQITASSTPDAELRLNRRGLTESIKIFEAKNLQSQNFLSLPLEITDPSGETTSEPSPANANTGTMKKIGSKTATDTLLVF